MACPNNLHPLERQPLTCTIDWLCHHVAVLRLHQFSHTRIGDPYIWVCTGQRLDDTTMKLIGAMTSPGIEGTKAIVKALNGIGISRAVFERIKDGNVRSVTITREIP